MSTREARGIQTQQDEEESVARFLQQNPEFFESHLQLLAKLRIPHARGSATISLVERQVEVLRERHAAMEQKLADFVTVARANDAVAEKLHRFTRRLLRAQTRQSAFADIWEIELSGSCGGNVNNSGIHFDNIQGQSGSDHD